MFKKFAFSLVIAALIFGGSFNVVSAQGITLQQLVDLFISLGIIAPDKAAAAKSAVASANTGVGVDTSASYTAPSISLTSNSINTITSQHGSNGATSVSALFYLNILASDGDFTFPTQSTGNTFYFGIYKNGQRVYPNASSSVSWTIPSSGVVTYGLASGQAFKLSQNNQVTIPVSYIFEGRSGNGSLIDTGSGAYSVGLEGVSYVDASGAKRTLTFMSGNTSWRTNSVNLIGQSVSTQQSITVVSPNGGETFIMNRYIAVDWKQAVAGTITMYVINSSGTSLYSRSIPGQSASTGMNATSLDLNAIKVAGQYKVKICDGANVCDTSDNYFTLKTLLPPQPTIHVSSPQEGDIWTVGSIAKISWNKFSPTADVFVYLSGGGNAEGYSKYIGTPTGSGYLDYKVTSADLPTTPGSSWKVAVCNGKLASGGNNCGWSGQVYVKSDSSIQPSLTFSSDKTSVNSGEAFSMTWFGTNVNSPCTASGGGWSGSKDVAGTVTFVPNTSFDENLVYTLTCSGVRGSISKTVTVNVRAVVPAPSLSFTSDRVSVNSGEPFTLTWFGTNVNSPCTASGAWPSGDRDIAGSVTYVPNSSISDEILSYTLTCKGPGGSITKTVTVTLNPTVGIYREGSNLASGMVSIEQILKLFNVLR